ncbi:hypothetical protein ACFXAW_09015 [Streptomyces sp. NPDC059445]|uniref:hypothetical protein n=1 Tax=Streptomyces sp. NPDC059445 TaxID=3346832 RepID=UPI00367A3179
MRRKSDRGPGAGTLPGDTPGGRGHVVAVVVPEPSAAVPLVDWEEPGAEIAVVCLRAGTKEERTALDRALSAAVSRGCTTASGPRVVDADGADAVAALTEELAAIGPERLHTLDPDPIHRSIDDTSGVPSYDVPPAHAETAALALAAARALQSRTGRPLFVDCRRGEADPLLGIAAARRHPVPVNWLSAGLDGRLTAFLPTAAGVARWYEEVPGGAWHGPEVVEGHGLLPGLAVVRDPHGMPQLFALRRTTRGAGEVHIEVVHAAQYRTGRPLTPWHSLGGPNVGAWRKGREVGFPTAAFDATGRLFVFVRNFGHSISYRCRSTDGSWTGWQHLGGTRVSDELLAVTAGHGGVEVFARARDTAAVVRWYTGPGGAWTEDRTVPFDVRPGTLAPAPEPGAVLFRDPRTGDASYWSPGAPAPCTLGDAEGEGPQAVAGGVELDGWAHSVLVRRDAHGACVTGVYPQGRADVGVWWQDLGAPSIGAPAVAVSRTGQVTVATRAPGGRLLLTRRQEAGTGLSFDGWRPASG